MRPKKILIITACIIGAVLLVVNSLTSSQDRASSDYLPPQAENTVGVKHETVDPPVQQTVKKPKQTKEEIAIEDELPVLRLETSSKVTKAEVPVTQVVEVEDSELEEKSKPAVHAPSLPITQAKEEHVPCFMNKVYFHPARCSRTAAILDAILPGQGGEVTRIAHIGSADALYRTGEFVDLFEKSEKKLNKFKGTAYVFNLLNKNLSAGAPLNCGECCECVSAVEKVPRIDVPFDITLFQLPPKEGTEAPAMPQLPWAGSTNVRVINGSPKATHSRFSQGLDVLSIDTLSDDTRYVTNLVLSKAVQVRKLLQFTTVHPTTNYSTLVSSLKKVGFTCFIFTAKPTGRSFRGVRIPAYPVAVQLTDCWRPPYALFYGDTYQISCANENDLPTLHHLRGHTTKVHRGSGSGCLVPHRLGRKKKIEDLYNPNKAKE